MTCNRQHAFAMVMAIVLISLTAISLSLLGVTAAQQAQRSILAGQEAQFRQLLQAGAIAAEQPGDIMRSLTLPAELRGQSATVTLNITLQTPQKRICQIDASLDRHHRSQRVTLLLNNGRWKIVEADLAG